MGRANATPFIDVNAFVSPASFTYGNTPATGAYGLRNPHFFNQDLSLSRNFQVRENLRLVFGADSFNLFNNVRFGSIGTNITQCQLRQGRRADQFAARIPGEIKNRVLIPDLPGATT